MLKKSERRVSWGYLTFTNDTLTFYPGPNSYQYPDNDLINVCIESEDTAHNAGITCWNYCLAMFPIIRGVNMPVRSSVINFIEVGKSV